jgi:uncharacterized lipoprotein
VILSLAEDVPSLHLDSDHHLSEFAAAQHCQAVLDRAQPAAPLKSVADSEERFQRDQEES